MSVAVITGSAGLIGSEAVRYFAAKGMHVAGIDNDMRKYFFGPEASTEWMRKHLEATVPDYQHFSIDIRDHAAILELFKRFGKEISLVIHTAAQPSHDWAAREPLTDFSVNATGTLNAAGSNPAISARKRPSFLPRRIKFMAIPPMNFHWLNRSRAGNWIRPTNLPSMESRKSNRSTIHCIASSGRPRLLPM